MAMKTYHDTMYFRAVHKYRDGFHAEISGRDGCFFSARRDTRAGAEEWAKAVCDHCNEIRAHGKPPTEAGVAHFDGIGR